MKKTNFFRSIAAMAMTAAVLVGCGGNSQSDEKPAAATADGSSSLSIAFVEIDSILSQYTFCQEFKAILEKKNQTMENTLNAEQKKLQAAVQNFQQKLQNNGFTSQSEAERQQMAIQQQDQNLQTLAQRLATELQNETVKYQDALLDSLHNYLKEYNKSKKYTYILTKQGDNILYADPACDITNDIVAGLNKAYKKGTAETKPATTEKKDDKAEEKAEEKNEEKK